MGVYAEIKLGGGQICAMCKIVPPPLNLKFKIFGFLDIRHKYKILQSHYLANIYFISYSIKKIYDLLCVILVFLLEIVKDILENENCAKK